MTSIAEKYAAQWMPNGEVSLEQVIQAAIDEATEIRKQEVALILTGAHARIRQLEAERVPDYTGGDAELLRQRVPEGWRFDRCSDGTINVIKDTTAGVNVGRCAEDARRIPEEVLWMLANDMLAAAPAQENV